LDEEPPPPPMTSDLNSPRSLMVLWSSLSLSIVEEEVLDF